MISGRPAKILLIDSNVYFAKRLGDALKKEGFDVQSSTQPAFALTTLEYDAPTAIVCATNMREMGALEIAKIIHADPKHATLPIIALGDGSQRALMEAFQAGCEDYIDRARPPAVIATHIRNIVISKAEGFQPTQMLNQADTSLSGSLTHHDLPGVLQMLGHAHQTGALHINAGATDAILFFDAGSITHAECGNLFGDEAVIHIIKNCVEGGQGVYKFVYGATSTQHTVLRNATDLMLDAMREYDESSRDTGSSSPSSLDASPIAANSLDSIDANSIDDEPSLLQSLEPDSPNVSEVDTTMQATNNTDSGDQEPPFTNEAPLVTASDDDQTLDATSEVAQALLPVPQNHETDTYPSPEIEAHTEETVLPAPTQEQPVHERNESDQSLFAASEAEPTASLHRRDILQAELSSYPTTITDRILSNLRAHDDNPVDRALADLLSEQLSGNNAHPQPQNSDFADDSQHEDHVHHSDNKDKEQP
jgi:CheY-like chemotaxis protein